MNDFLAAWQLSRSRFDAELQGLSDEQLRWRLHQSALSIGQMALHVAGVELFFQRQLTGTPTPETLQAVERAAVQGVVDASEAFPVTDELITVAFVSEANQIARGLVERMLSAGADSLRAKELKSALGPMITGEGAFARLTFHAAYHQGQAYLTKTAPGFPPA